MMVEKSFKENKEGLQLWNIFDVDMTMVGNSLLRPGMLFYINPAIAQLLLKMESLLPASLISMILLKT